MTREPGRDAGASPFDGVDVEAMLRDPSRKQQLVTPMFDLVAPRYDDFTRLFSLGMDARWKRLLVRRVAASAPEGGRVLDVACGTGDIAFALAAVRPDLAITAIDASERMLSLARARRHALRAVNVELADGDLARLALADGAADVVTGGYAVRNAPSWRAALSELARVLRPGGTLHTLDFFQPAFPPWRAAYLAYLALAGRIVGWWWHREPMAYGYIARSIAHFTSANGFARALESAGFRVTHADHRLGGGIGLHTAVRR
jgi:demethylmenaquinone methyltransferase/2-methoxy-6-polyprenyl-1,4-benzoquinol methylase